MRIAVCAPQVPFIRGGAEIVSERLVEELRKRDHDAELVTVPFKWYPGERVLTQAFLWRLLDLEEADGVPIDLVIATKFPSYAVRHPNKVVWLLHQFRQAYELDRTELGQFDESPEGRALRREVHRLDRLALGEARKLFATSRNVADRLERSTGLVRGGAAAARRRSCPTAATSTATSCSRSAASTGRSASTCCCEALGADPSLRCVIAGDGPDRERLEQLAREHGLDGRAQFAGRVSEEELTDLYARCLAVYYAPVDEDFGMVPYEAFLAEKPVVTTTDAGGPLEVVRDRGTGLVVRARPRARSRRPARGWREHVDSAREWGQAGQARRQSSSPGTTRSTGCWREGRLLLAAAAGALRDRRLQRAAAARARAADRGRRRRAARGGARRAARDLALYHVGNDPEHHWWIVEALRKRPGVVVLHDFVLHHLVAGMTLGRKDSDGYLDAMQREAGAGRADARARRRRRAPAAGLGATRARVPAHRRGAEVRRPA